MNNITGDKMFAHIDRVFGEHKPITADVFLTNYCNNKCPYCTYNRWELSSSAYSMKFDDFMKYTRRLIDLGVEGIILTGGGEPSVAKDFEEIVNWLDTEQIKYGINTNFNKFFHCMPEYLKVSLDAWDEDSYLKKRGVRAYSTVRNNIIEFSKIKSEKTRLGIQLLAQSVEEVYSFYKGNKDLPVDYISIRPVESTGGLYYRMPGYSIHKPENIVQAIKELQALDSRVVLNYKWDLISCRQSECTAQWAQIAINERGEVMYCCHKPYEIVGHILDKDILSKKEKYITDMSKCDVPCRMTGPNYEVSRMLSPQSNTEFI